MFKINIALALNFTTKNWLYSHFKQFIEYLVGPTIFVGGGGADTLYIEPNLSHVIEPSVQPHLTMSQMSN